MSAAAGVDEAALVQRARGVRERAYAPYSGFRVGAVAVTVDGDVFEGVNVENAAYGLSRCAEQSALQAMATAGVRAEVAVVAVAGDGDAPVTPCGACRQVIYEFGPRATVLASGERGDVLARPITELLPDAFGPARLARSTTPDGAGT